MGNESDTPAAHRVVAMSDSDLAREWDALATSRLDQIENHRDLSYEHVIVPSLLSMLGSIEQCSVLDAGCGLGFVTAQIARSATEVLAVDLSPRQIDLARERHGAPNVSYVCGRLEDVVEDLSAVSFDAVVANMTLMDVLDLDGFLAAIVTALKPAGRLAFTLTHPCYWPRYWGYEGASWFAYQEEIVISAPFEISLDRTAKFETTHVHRPLSKYISPARTAGLRLVDLAEPMPDAQTAARYPTVWQFPRYLAGLLTT